MRLQHIHKRSIGIWSYGSFSISSLINANSLDAEHALRLTITEPLICMVGQIFAEDRFGTACATLSLPVKRLLFHVHSPQFLVVLVTTRKHFTKNHSEELPFV